MAGASGVGGSIKAAVIKCLGENTLRGIVRAYVGGEQWFNRKREIIRYMQRLNEK